MIPNKPAQTLLSLEELSSFRASRFPDCLQNGAYPRNALSVGVCPCGSFGIWDTVHGFLGKTDSLETLGKALRFERRSPSAFAALVICDETYIDLTPPNPSQETYEPLPGFEPRQLELDLDDLLSDI